MSIDPTSKTTLDLVTGALRKIGQYAPGEALAAADANDALDTFNGLMDLWSAQKLFVYNKIETVQNLSAGVSTYTLGLGGYFNIERPLRIDRAYARLNTGNSAIDFPCEIVALPKYTAIGQKNQPGPWPKMAFYNTGYPLSTLYFWPVPQTNIEFHLWTEQVFNSLDLTTSLNLPRGYYLGLQYALAEVLCPEYGMGVPPDIKRFAHNFRSVLKSLNGTPRFGAFIDGAIVAGNGASGGFVINGGF